MTSKPDSPVSPTGQSGFVRSRTEGYIEDYRAQDDSSTSLVSSRPHAQPEEEDPADEGIKRRWKKRPRRREMSTSTTYDR
jgi:hypothetical protein